MPDFECRLKKYRLLKDLTQEQLAAQVGVRRETIMRLEKAQYNPSLKLAIDIARVVEAPILFPVDERIECGEYWFSVLGREFPNNRWNRSGKSGYKKQA